MSDELWILLLFSICSVICINGSLSLSSFFLSPCSESESKLAHAVFSPIRVRRGGTVRVQWMYGQGYILTSININTRTSDAVATNYTNGKDLLITRICL